MNGARIYGLHALVQASREELTREEMAKIEKATGCWIQSRNINGYTSVENELWKRNRFLISVYNTVSKDQFNAVVRNWASRIIQGHENEVYNGTAIKTVQNYHKFIKTMGFVDNDDIVVEQYGKGGLRINMQQGCPYSLFCKETGNEKCVRGSVLEFILNKAEEGRAEPMFKDLKRFESKKGYDCIIHIVPAIQTLDRLDEEKGPLTIL